MSKSEKQKKLRKAVRELVGLAHGREISAALAELETKFKAWRAGKIDCFELNELIHKHHHGISRDLWSKYQCKPDVLLPLLVHSGVIAESEVPEELLAELRAQLDGLRALDGAGMEREE